MPLLKPSNPPGRSMIRNLNYGLGIFGPYSMFIFQVTFLILFYTNTVGLRAELAGLALTLGRLWDAVTDPAMGGLSDRTPWRLGRRRSYMLLGAIPLAVSFVALWTPPVGWSQTGLFVYLLVTYMVYNTFTTVVMVPYMALGAELSDDYNERTRIMAFRMVFQYLGWYAGATGVKVNLLLLEHASESGGIWNTLVAFREGYAACAVVFGGVAVLAITWSALNTKEPPMPAVRRQMGHLAALLRPLKNRSFVLLILAFLATSLFEALGIALFPFLIGLWYYAGDMDMMMSGMFWLMLPTLGAAVLSLPLWTLLSRRMGKKRAFLLGCTLTSVVTMLNFVTINPHATWLIWPWLVLFGFAVTSPLLLTPSIIPDIVDEEELATGVRREGSFFGMLTFVQKAAGALGAGLTGITLGLIGFEEGAATQSDATVLGIRAIYAFLRGGGYLLAFSVMLWFPLTPERVAATRRRLDGRSADAGVG